MVVWHWTNHPGCPLPNIHLYRNRNKHINDLNARRDCLLILRGRAVHDSHQVQSSYFGDMYFAGSSITDRVAKIDSTSITSVLTFSKLNFTIRLGKYCNFKKL